ncbi:hypothetical protein D3Z38_08875 [Clostridiales bacterium]|nr:hypothetical protein [Clostridiales bacterium]
MKYRKKPVVIEAVRYTGTEESKAETWHFCEGTRIHVHVDVDGNLVIETLEGPHIVRVGDYVIKGVAGEIYPCNPWIFEQTYERAEE